MARALVTGGAGFIGSHLVDALIDQGHDVIIVDSLLLGKKENINAKAIFHQLDIRETHQMQALCEGVDVIFHLAADPRVAVSLEDPMGTHDINVTGTLSVLVAAYRSGVKKVIFSSSCAAYGDASSPISETAPTEPLSPYGLHKLLGEEYMRMFARTFALATVCLRYFNVYGTRKSADGSYPMVIPVFLKQKQEGKEMTVVGDGIQTRDYVHVSDVVRANILAWQSEIIDGSPVNIGSHRQISVLDIASLIGGESIHLPERMGEMRYVEAENARAKELLGWEPQMPFEEGLAVLKQYWGVE